MSKNENLITFMDELIKEQKEIIDEFVKEAIQPLIDYRVSLEKKAFEKAYKELKELEREV